MILLDTHAALWLIASPDRLGREARDRIATEPGVFVSAITLVETSIKRMLGRLDVPDDLARRFSESGLQHLALTHEHAAALETFPELVRHDPFDRLLLAQARVERCLLVTADERLLAAGAGLVVDARR